MYDIDDSYKFELSNRIFYTGKILEIDDFHLKILTIKGETIIMKKEEIIQAWKMGREGSDAF
ncbi:MAG TPA: hypothetical protein ENG37_01965 [Firmicutes bacterium]|nr:hypothetical protein [Bacillota bacterium]